MLALGSCSATTVPSSLNLKRRRTSEGIELPSPLCVGGSAGGVSKGVSSPGTPTAAAVATLVPKMRVSIAYQEPGKQLNYPSCWLDTTPHFAVKAVPTSTNTRSNEDTFTAGAQPAPGLSYFGVFDGHGGVQVARYCAERLHGVLSKQLAGPGPAAAVGQCPPQREPESLALSLTKAFEEVDAGAALYCGDISACGSTACVALLTPGNIVVANTGVHFLLRGALLGLSSLGLCTPFG